MPNYRQFKGLPINNNELKNAEIVIMRVLQQSSFPEEIHDFNKNKHVDKRSRLYNLDPFIDDYGSIRVGGRLGNAKISYEKRHQIVIPNDHFITDLIINYYHYLFSRRYSYNFICHTTKVLDYRRQKSNKKNLSVPSARDLIVALCAPFFLDLALRARTCALRIHLSLFLII